MKKLTLYFSMVFITCSAANAQNIYTIAGVGGFGYSGDGGPATAAGFNQPAGSSFDKQGNLYVADWENNRIRKINTSGIVTTIAGNGVKGYTGNGGAATAAEIGLPNGVAEDAAGNVYETDAYSGTIRMINTSGIISTIAGKDHPGYSGDGGAATDAELNNPGGIQVDIHGNIYFADSQNDRIRVISTTGVITTVAGGGTLLGDGGPATAAAFDLPLGVSVDSLDQIYISDYGNYRIRMVNTSGIINTIAGTGVTGYTGDGGPATAAEIKGAWGVWADPINKNIYIADWQGNRVRVINTSGVMGTATGTGSALNGGNGGPATAASVGSPSGVVTDRCGNLFITTFSSYIREVVYDSICTTGIANIKDNQSINAYPNPASGSLNIVMNNIPGKVTISLINYLGQNVINCSYSGRDVVTLNTTPFSSGVYFLKVLPESGIPIYKKVEIIH